MWDMTFVCGKQLKYAGNGGDVLETAYVCGK